MKEYLVISQKDKWFSGRFDPELLQSLLNQRAREGWRVVSMATASRETLVSIQSKDELIILMEREIPSQAQRIERESKLADAARKTFAGGPPPPATPKPPAKTNGGEPEVYQL